MNEKKIEILKNLKHLIQKTNINEDDLEYLQSNLKLLHCPPFLTKRNFHQRK